MLKLTYKCDNCEDIAIWDCILREGFHCGCGGHLHMVKEDHFVRDANIDDCALCINKNTEKCINCNHGVSNV